MAEWAWSGRGRALAADLWRGVALGAASVLGTARALHACDAVLQAGARRGGGAALAANLFSSLLIGIIGEVCGGGAAAGVCRATCDACRPVLATNLSSSLLIGIVCECAEVRRAVPASAGMLSGS